MKRRTFFLLILLVGTGFMVRHSGYGEPVALFRSLEAFPMSFGKWQGKRVYFNSRIERKLGVTDYVYRIYNRDRDRYIHLYVGYYDSQEHGRMIHSPKNCLPGNGWYIAERGSTELTIPPYKPFEVNRFVIENGSKRELVLYWYQQSGGRIVTNEYLGRVFLVYDALTKHRTDAALIRVNIPINQSEKRSLEEGKSFLEQAYPKLMEYLPHEDTSLSS